MDAIIILTFEGAVLGQSERHISQYVNATYSLLQAEPDSAAMTAIIEEVLDILQNVEEVRYLSKIIPHILSFLLPYLINSETGKPEP